MTYPPNLKNDDFDQYLLITSQSEIQGKMFNYSEQEVDYAFPTSYSKARTLPLTPRVIQKANLSFFVNTQEVLSRESLHIVCRLGLRPRPPLGELTALPKPPSQIIWATSKNNIKTKTKVIPRTKIAMYRRHTPCPKKKRPRYFQIQLSHSLVDFYNFYTVGNRNEHTTITCNLLP